MLAAPQSTSLSHRPAPTHRRSAIAGATTPDSLAPASQPPTAAQRSWLRLFQASHILRQHRLDVLQPAHLTPSPASIEYVDSTLPSVGGNYDFVQLQEWPSYVCYVANNVFKASQPFPVTPSGYRYKCGCDRGCCIANNGTRLTSGCINAGTDLICDDTNCSVGAACGNRFLPRHQLDLISTRVGLGVVCSARIPKSAFIVEYVGEMLLYEDAINLRDRRYLVELKAEALWDGPVSLFIDASACGNKSRFINHSCEPNCALYECEWTNSVRLGIFATKDIPPLQELTFRYRENNLTLFTCQCNRENCVSETAKRVSVSYQTATDDFLSRR